MVSFIEFEFLLYIAHESLFLYFMLIVLEVGNRLTLVSVLFLDDQVF